MRLTWPCEWRTPQAVEAHHAQPCDPSANAFGVEPATAGGWFTLTRAKRRTATRRRPPPDAGSLLRERWWLVWACPAHLDGLRGIRQFGGSPARATSPALRLVTDVERLIVARTVRMNLWRGIGKRRSGRLSPPGTRLHSRSARCPAPDAVDLGLSQCVFGRFLAHQVSLTRRMGASIFGFGR